MSRFGWTPHRQVLLAGLRTALDALRNAGCQRAYVDGSFVTAKRTPQDFDGCWDVEGVDLALLDPTLMTFANQREEQKRMYGGELFPSEARASPDGTNFLQLFQRDRFTGAAKGIVMIDLRELPQ